MTRRQLRPAYATPAGRCYHGPALEVLRQMPSESVNLVLTSPPFPLRRRKVYGNVDADEFGSWLAPIAGEVRRVLARDGSWVLELGPAWQRGRGVRSLYQYELVLQLCGGPGPAFHLCQEFYWYNPSKLPTPAEWVTIRRTRVKDAVNVLYWFSRTPCPDADNRRVLVPYSPSHRRQQLNGFHLEPRPSGHTLSPAIGVDNGGAIPPNLLNVANTRSADPYYRRCREAGLPVHPAMMPAAVAEFFVRFLTRPGQLVLDPFAGSNTTGAVAEQLGRRWLAIEARRDYVEASRLRFGG